jgi:DMSO/TMAO reductase YedYZ molybdopterin-dependent catalytic subunit
VEESRAKNDAPKETMMPQPERREALPDPPVPAGLAVPEASRLWVDVLGAQPLEVSRSEVEALAAQTHTAHGVCEDGWMVPAPQWEGVAVAALLGDAGVQPPRVCSRCMQAT